mgnify:FL=1
MIPSICKTILMPLISLTLSASIYAQTAEEICKKHVEKMGGEELLSKLKSITIDRQVLANSAEFPQKVIVENNKAIYTESPFQGKKIISAVNDTNGWQINPYVTGSDGPQKLTKEEINQCKDQTDLLGPFYNPESKGIIVKLIGREKVLGQETFKLNLLYKTGFSTDVNVTAKDYFVVRISTKYGETLYSDYKKVDGYWFPFATEMKHGSYSTIFNVFKIKVNAPVDEKLFEFPKG